MGTGEPDRGDPAERAAPKTGAEPVAADEATAAALVGHEPEPDPDVSDVLPEPEADELPEDPTTAKVDTGPDFTTIERDPRSLTQDLAPDEDSAYSPVGGAAGVADKSGDPLAEVVEEAAAAQPSLTDLVAQIQANNAARRAAHEAGDKEALAQLNDDAAALQFQVQKQVTQPKQSDSDDVDFDELRTLREEHADLVAAEPTSGPGDVDPVESDHAPGTDRTTDDRFGEGAGLVGPTDEGRTAPPPDPGSPGGDYTDPPPDSDADEPGSGLHDAPGTLDHTVADYGITLPEADPVTTERLDPDDLDLLE